MRKWVLSGILASEETYLSHLEALLLVRRVQGLSGQDGPWRALLTRPRSQVSLGAAHPPRILDTPVGRQDMPPLWRLGLPKGQWLPVKDSGTKPSWL